MTLELNKIYNEDCIEGMERIPDESVDLILTDLPYGRTEIKWDKELPIDKLWEQWKRIIKYDGTIILFAQQPLTSKLVSSNYEMFQHNLTWHKDKCGNFMQAKTQPRRMTEDILVFSRGKFLYNAKIKPTYNPQMQKREKEYKDNRTELKKTAGTEAMCGGRKASTYVRDVNYDGTVTYPSDLVYFSIEQKDRIHPTQKPVSLFEYLIKTYSNEGDLILDNCMGSGTTAIACLNTSRNYIGFELDEEYYNKSIERIELHKNNLNK